MQTVTMDQLLFFVLINTGSFVIMLVLFLIEKKKNARLLKELSEYTIPFPNTNIPLPSCTEDKDSTN